MIISSLYLSAPMSGLPDLNRPALAQAAATLRSAGFMVFNPGELGIDHWHTAMKACIKQLPDYDALVQFPGWEKSRGARLEHAVAESLGLTICSWELMECHLRKANLPLEAASFCES